MKRHIIIEAPSKWEYVRVALALIGCSALGAVFGYFAARMTC